MNKIIDFIKRNKKLVVAALAIVLAISITISIVSYINSGKSPVIPRSGARIIIDCGARVGFMVELIENEQGEEDFLVTDVFACEKKYEKYIEDITYEESFIECITHVLNYAMNDGHIFNADYCSVLVSVESKDPQMYPLALILVNDEVLACNQMGKIYCCGIAIAEYDTDIQRLANRKNIPYSVAYVCTEFEKDSESLSAKKLMKYKLYEISQMVNNANGRDRNYFWRYLTKLSEKNLAPYQKEK